MGSPPKERSLAIRQRKSHRKSRLGCGNCKLRSVKCDETKPACTRCRASGFTCNYVASTPSLQLANTHILRLDLNSGLAPPVSRLSIPVAAPLAGRTAEYEMRERDFAVLNRFKKRTVLTMGNNATRWLYSDRAFNLGKSNPFLLHVFLSLALIHDTNLNPTLTTPSQLSALAFHWYHGTVLFQRKLQQPNLTGPERDALWAAAALLGAAAFGYMDTNADPDDPAKAWPLKEPGPMDLDWLKMSVGKKVVWELCDPTREDSAFRPMVDQQEGKPIPNGTMPILPGALPEEFYSLCNLTASSTASSNPYHIAASIIAQLLPHHINDDNTLLFLPFISQLDPQYKRLLEEKDPRAMLLLVWWYAKTAETTLWWLKRRSVVEGKAICIWLEERCGGEPKILALLEFPKMALRVAGEQTKMKGPGSVESDESHLRGCIPFFVS